MYLVGWKSIKKSNKTRKESAIAGISVANNKKNIFISWKTKKIIINALNRFQ